MQADHYRVWKSVREKEGYDKFLHKNGLQMDVVNAVLDLLGHSHREPDPQHPTFTIGQRKGIEFFTICDTIKAKTARDKKIEAWADALMAQS